MSSTPPPGTTHRTYEKTFRDRGFLGPEVQVLKDLVRPFQFDPTPAPPPLTGAQAAHWATLKDMDESLIGYLASGEFLLRVNISATPWTLAGGIPASTTTLDGAPCALPSHAFARVDADVTACAGGTAPARRKDFLAEAPHPELLFARVARPQRRPRRYMLSFLVLDVTSSIAGLIVHQLKQRIRVPRPDDAVFTRPVNPVIDVPAYASYPGGHSTLAHALRHVVAELVGATAAEKIRLQQLADKVAEDRVLAGLHTRAMDTDDGRTLGDAIGTWMVGAGLPARFVDYPNWSTLLAKARLEWS